MTMRTMAVIALAMTVGACGGEADGGAAEGGANDTAAVMMPADTMADTTSMMAAPTGAPVEVVMRDASGRELGRLSLADSGEGIAVTGSLRGLAPGEHGIHLHTTGVCEPPFESAGAHWNPTSRQHGTENPQGPHLGDMMNLTVGADSTATVQVTTPSGTLRGANALLDADGGSVVVHAAADDYRTDPSGNSGARIACGAATA
jgi:Cu-Zn family superoxide dismutase